MADDSSYSNANNDDSSSRKNGWFKRLFSNSNDNDLRETIEELIVDDSSDENGEDTPEKHERLLLSNIFKLRDLTAYDVMVPRVDIIAVEASISKEDLMNIYAETPRSRVPVFKETLDNINGTVHIKDFLGQIAKKQSYNLSKITREVPIISPSMPVMDLLIQMRETKNHMSLVIDEYGGIDGLVTLGDVLELITGEIDDIYDDETTPQLKEIGKDLYLADGRLPIEEFEQTFDCEILDEEDREEIDTLAGFVFSHAGRVPAKGEIIEHSQGFSFEIIDGDGRRIHTIKIHTENEAKAS